MREGEKQDKIYEELLMLLRQVNSYFKREDLGAQPAELVILKGLIRKRKDNILDLMNGKKDNLIQFPVIKDK